MRQKSTKLYYGRMDNRSTWNKVVDGVKWDTGEILPAATPSVFYVINQ